MAIGIVNNEDFNKEHEKLRKKDIVIDLDKRDIIKSPERGRGIGNKEVSEAVRNFVAELGIEGYSNKEIKELTGLSQSSISAYKVGATSTTTYNKPDEKLIKHISSVKDKISRRAKKVTIKALDILLENDGDKLSDASARDLANIAKSASAIVRDMEDNDSNKNQNINNGVQFIMMAPPPRTESSFDAIDVSALDG